MPIACVLEDPKTGAIVHVVRDARRRPDRGRLLGRRAVVPADGVGRWLPRGSGRSAAARSTSASPPKAFDQPRRPGRQGGLGRPARARRSASGASPPGTARRRATGLPLGGLGGEWGEAAEGRCSASSTAEINALAFSPDGRWLAASASRERTIRFWQRLTRPAGPRGVAVHADAAPRRAGQRPRAWPDGPGARQRRRRRGRPVLGPQAEDPGRDPRGRGSDASTVVRLAGLHTTEGLFDGSMPGERLIKWRVGDQMVTLEQSDRHPPRLPARRELPPCRSTSGPRLPPRKDQVPELKIVDPPDARESRTDAVELTLWLGDEDLDLKGLRLYQNGVPVRGERRTSCPASSPTSRTTTEVQLRKGVKNRLYAMASRPGATDGKTADVALNYDGPEPAGRLHTLAIGIGKYTEPAAQIPPGLTPTRWPVSSTPRGLQGGDQPGRADHPARQ